VRPNPIAFMELWAHRSLFVFSVPSLFVSPYSLCWSSEFEVNNESSSRAYLLGNCFGLQEQQQVILAAGF
jgi:hypothetical protein